MVGRGEGDWHDLFSVILQVLSNNRDDLLYMSPALLLSAGLSLFYVTTNSYPSSFAGLYFVVGETILEQGFRLPLWIPYYTLENPPFAYPPLGLYGLAVLRGLELPILLIARVLPPVMMTVLLVPIYFTTLEVSGRKLAAAATALLSIFVIIVDGSYFYAGGVVRAPGFVLYFIGVYASVRYFSRGGGRWKYITLVMFGLTVLTHPGHASLFGWTVLTAFAVYDRSWGGFTDGLEIALGGLLVASPWWLTVIHHHGVDVFFAAAAVYSGAVGVPVETVKAVARTFAVGVSAPSNGMALVWILGGIGTAKQLFNREYFLIVWLAVFVFVGAGHLSPLVMLAGVGSSALIDAGLRDTSVADSMRHDSPVRATPGRDISKERRQVIVGLAAASVAGFSTVGTVRKFERIDSRLNDNHMAAMDWVRVQTDADATFLLMGGPMEWFPAFAKRTVVIGNWGREWVGPKEDRRQKELVRMARRCQSEECLKTILQSLSVSPDYLYVPSQRRELTTFLHSSSFFMREYQNEGVVIFRNTGLVETEMLGSIR